ncbi:MAG: nicotinic acid mononucleotide adenylyltransferase [Fibrobacteres bacterium]|nr:nicotinic acid mononucleotide adenylyltransferase [Fibrobacterota bacterium]
MKYCIFGGSFDPPHEGHRHVARSASDTLRLDRVFWVPAQDPPHKSRPGTPFEKRVAMVRLATADMPRHSVSEIEARLPVPSYSLNTILAMKAEHGPEHQWHFLIGADNWAIFPTWHRWEEVLKEATLVVYPRNGVPLGALREGVIGLTLLEFPGESRAIRESLEATGDLEKAGVLPEIRDYVRSEGLYGLQAAGSRGMT